MFQYLGEPNNYEGDSGYIRENCISSLDLKRNCLNDEHCEYSFPAICEKKSTTALTSVVPTTTTTFQSYHDCEQGWTLHNGKCYFYNSVPLDNESAKRWCSEYGATLMNIHNQDDLSFALSRNQADDSFWVRNTF